MAIFNKHMLMLGGALLVASGFGAQAGEIFTPVTGATPKVDAPAAAASVFARVDTIALSRGLKASTPGKALSLDIAPGVSIPVVLTRQDPTGPEMQAFAANSPGDPASSSTIVIDGDTVYAVIQYNNATYEISHVADGVHRVTRLNQDMFPGDKVVTKERPNRAAPDLSLVTSVVGAGAPLADMDVAGPSANTVVKVLLMATEKAKAENSNWKSVIQAAYTDANTAFSNSGVALTFQAVGYNYYWSGYNETNKTYDKVLADLRASSGVLSFRNTNKVDLVAVVRSANGAGGAYCGMGYLPDPPTSSTSNQGYSVTNISCAVGNHSFAHETGHNMGLRHDRYVEGAFGKYQTKYNYGYSNTTKLVRSVMAYADYCSSLGKSCTRVGYFSNPFKTVNGGAIGKNTGTTDPAYNARRLSETKATIAAYR